MGPYGPLAELILCKLPLIVRAGVRCTPLENAASINVASFPRGFWESLQPSLKSSRLMASKFLQKNMQASHPAIAGGDVFSPARTTSGSLHNIFWARGSWRPKWHALYLFFSRLVCLFRVSI